MTAPKEPTAATLRKYGLTLDDYRKMLESQGGKCFICKKTLTMSRVPHNDHNHATGEYRGLLCSPCNERLGFMHEDTEWLRNALRYLISPPSRGVFDVPRRHRDAPPQPMEGKR